MSKVIRIGCGAGFWGDSPGAPRRLVEGVRLDYLVLEYLAELTLSILAHLRARDPNAGFVTDVPSVVRDLSTAIGGGGPKLVTNGGGTNPSACTRSLSALLVEAGLGDRRLAAVAGDDLLGRMDELQNAGEAFENLETGQPFSEFGDPPSCVHAYLGGEGIAAALAEDADIVITGRVADASLVVGPALHEFGWATDDWNRIAGATVAGHLVECGAQVTGGMNSTWTDDVRLGDIGYPFVDLQDDGCCTVGKPDGTGGRVDVAGVAEQLVYEIGDPRHYLGPDVDADFSAVSLTPTGPDRVGVAGAIGRRRPDRLKVTMARQSGWRAEGTLVVAGRRSDEKARATGEAIFERLRMVGVECERTLVEVLGSGDSLPGVVPRPSPPPWEVVLRVAVADSSREKVERFCREITPMVTSGPPGVTGYTGARPRPTPVLAHWPTTVDRELVEATVDVRTAAEWLS